MRMRLTVGIHRLEEGPAVRTEAAGRTEIVVRAGVVVHNLAADHSLAGPAGRIVRHRSLVGAAAGVLVVVRNLAAGHHIHLDRSWSPGHKTGPGEGIHPGCNRILTCCGGRCSCVVGVVSD